MSKTDYDTWLKKMNEGKFNHYLAWFNVNIKQASNGEVKEEAAAP